jgi:hypothetical protein
MTQPRPHVALLGDSIFDNSAYTSGEPDVAEHLRRIAPGWNVSLVAEDGATVGSISQQLRRTPKDATHLVVSVGGNDALGNSDLLSLARTSSVQLLEALADRLAPFEFAYRRAIDEVVAAGRPVAVCTIYNGALEDGRATAARMALALFNDVILRTAITRRVDILELRTICTERADYANLIEPSGQGGLKIARGIACAISPLAGSRRPAHAWGSCEDTRHAVA